MTGVALAVVDVTDIHRAAKTLQRHLLLPGDRRPAALRHPDAAGDVALVIAEVRPHPPHGEAGSRA